MGSKPVVSIQNVSKDFRLPHERHSSVKQVFIATLRGRRSRGVDIQHALQDVSFDVREGEFFGIVGRNGSGKSTLLKMIAGIYQPTAGKITVRGKLVPFIELGVGFNPELSGRENVYLNGALLGFSKDEIDRQYDAIVEFAELEEFMDQKLKNYSSGMQVRLAFSLAIRARADVLLIDEVLAVGDSEFQRKCFEYFKKLKHNKKTVIFVSHDMSAVQQYCDRAALIEASKLVKVGKPSEIAMLYAKLFMGQSATSDTVPLPEKSALSPSGEERWGDGWAQWESVKAELVESGDNGEAEFVEVRATGKAMRAVEQPIFGFSVKGADFKQLAGTNTVRRSITTSPLKPGDTFTVTWRVPNIFNTGRHYVDCTIAHDRASEVSDRWPDAANFLARRLEENPYPVYPPGITFLYNQGSKQASVKKARRETN